MLSPKATALLRVGVSGGRHDAHDRRSRIAASGFGGERGEGGDCRAGQTLNRSFLAVDRHSLMRVFHCACRYSVLEKPRSGIGTCYIDPPRFMQTTQQLDPIDAAEDALRYREGVETLLRLKSEKTISNSLPAHAAVLFEVFFKNAEDQVRIFCKNLDKEVFDDPSLLESAKWALFHGRQINIIVQEEPQESEFRGMLEHAKIPIHRADKAMTDQRVNFAVMDRTALRVEPNNEECRASAVMHCPDKAGAWAHYFDLMLHVLRSRKAHHVAA